MDERERAERIERLLCLLRQAAAGYRSAHVGMCADVIARQEGGQPLPGHEQRLHALAASQSVLFAALDVVNEEMGKMGEVPGRARPLGVPRRTGRPPSPGG